MAQSSVKFRTKPVLRTIGGNLPTPEDTEIPLMPVTWTPSFRTLVRFVLVSAKRMLAPESTRTRRVFGPPPTVVTVEESDSEVNIKLESEVELKGRNDTDKDELSAVDSHN